MKLDTFKLFVVMALITLVGADVFAESGVYVGGHIRRDRPGTITTLKNSGFTYVILFNVNVEDDGTLTTDGETICKNGQYVFGDTQPNYVSDIKSLKQAPTHINRIEICIGGWGNHSYEKIKNLIASQGVGTSSMLYKNFQALKNAIPEIDAVNNDDEHMYDVNSASKFHVMMRDLGYKTTLAPYTNKSFWQNLATSINNAKSGTVDRILIQCYDGGAGNNPSDWHINNIPLHAGRLNYQDFSETITVMNDWKKNKGVVGGFFWVYNNETWNLNRYATTVNRIFGAVNKTNTPVATIYADADHSGYAIDLPVGDFTMADLAGFGITNDDISSLKVKKGYKVTLYDNNDFSGSSANYTSNTNALGSLNDKVTSIKITAEGVSGLTGIYKIQSRSSNKYFDLDANAITNTTKVIQGEDEGVEVYQQFRFEEQGNGVYSIFSAPAGRVLDIADASTQNGALVQIYDDFKAVNQKFIVVDAGSGFYQLVALHCGKVIEIPNSSTASGEWLKLYDNNNQQNSHWKIQRVQGPGTKVATFYKDCNGLGEAIGLAEGTYTLAQMNMFGIKDNDVSSLKIRPGYKVTLYVDDKYAGNSKSYTKDTDCLVADNFNDMVSSIKIEAQGVTNLGGTYQIEGRNSNLFLDLKNQLSANGTEVIQWDKTTETSQGFQLKEIGNGVYTITGVKGNKSFDIKDASTANQALLQIWEPNSNNFNQQFIAVDAGSGYYQLVARHSAKALELPNNNLSAGTQVQQNDNTGQTHSHWKLYKTTPPTNANLSVNNLAPTVGDFVTLKVTVQGENLTYQWKKDGANITETTEPTLSFEGIGRPNAGTYLCEVKNQTGTVLSNEIDLFVHYPSYGIDITDNGGIIKASHVGLKSQEEVGGVIDNDATTKYTSAAIAGSDIWLSYESTQWIIPNSYSITSANDFAERDPKKIIFQGSENGENWVELDKQESLEFKNRFERQTFTLTATVPYKFFRLLVVERKSADVNIFQLAEWQIIGEVIVGADIFTSSNDRVNVYPNPIGDRFYIDMPTSGSVTIVDLKGRIIHTEIMQPGTQTVHVSDLDSGVYLLKINCDKQLKTVLITK